ncbi:MAG: type II CAAX endopeptidase family protein [Verrucomicrobium sp.]|nr:type II CAAX endopeptidase family protein [Verrucomicrobium sp.]
MDDVALPAWLLPVWGALTCLAAWALGRFLRGRPVRTGGVRPFDPPAADLLGFFVFLLAGAVLLGGFWFSGTALAGVLLLWVYREGMPGLRARLGLGWGDLSPAAALGLGLWIAAVISLPLQLFSGAMGALFQAFHWKTPLEPAVDLFLGTHGWRQLVPVVLAALVLAPVAEEVFFRGFLQALFKARFAALGERRGAIAGGLLSALCFAALHAHALTFLPLAAIGLVLALVHEWSGSLLLCIAVHFWFNLSTVLILLSGHTTL